MRPTFSVRTTGLSQYRDIPATLPDLVAFNALYNPQRLFCIQYMHNLGDPGRKVTYAQLQDAVLCCSVWLQNKGLAQSPTLVQGKVVKARPVALLMGSDVGWFVFFVTLLRLGVPVSPSLRLCVATSTKWNIPRL